jgi:glutamate/tyrosine decarboxylase-like PLP-dependent enzyme
MVFEKKTLSILSEALAHLERGFHDLPAVSHDLNENAIKNVMLEVAAKMQNNFPYAHPFYAGQMLKPPHPIARLAYALSLWINPNNHAIDGGRASSFMEKEAVAEIAEIFAWKTHLGHLCSGGTMANLEALWISACINPGKMIVASQQAHYTHQRISEVLRLPFRKVNCDKYARMDLKALEILLKNEDVATVVATIGTTGTGSVDPLPEILDLQTKFGFRLHADAAYGGYFTLIDNLDNKTRSALDCLTHVDSIVIDPHKHGLQPYGAGCVLFKDPSVGKYYKHDSPYTYFSSDELHLGEISLECSRAGASAVALWATHRLLPPRRGGEFAQGLNKSRQAAQILYDRLADDPRYLTVFPPELDIVIWAPKASSAALISNLTRQVFQKAAQKNLHLATFMFPTRILSEVWPDIKMDQEQIMLLRSCLMKPEHLHWIDRIWQVLDNEVLKANKLDQL